MLVEAVPLVAHLSQGVAMLFLQKNLRARVPLIRQVFNNPPTVLGKVDLASLLPFIPMLSSLNHAIAIGETISGKQVSKGVKWAEYSASAGLMLWIISSLSGILDLRTLVSIIISNILLQYIGYKLENVPSNNKKRDFGLLSVAWVLQATIWTQIITSFYGALSEATKEVPAFVYGVIWIMFSLFSGFGIWFSIIYFRDNNISADKHILKDRIGYNILSLVSKSTLLWMVYFGLKNADLPVAQT